MTNKLPDERIYYAQNREDLILESFFGDVKEGFYVDVGACHPHVASVTKRLYLKGWHGINIEPQTNLFGLFVAERPRDINLNIGISDKEGALVLRNFVNNQGLSTVAGDIKDEYEGKEEYEDVTIPVETLKKVLADQEVKTIHFLKVDVEGYEYEVLKGNDWKKFRPEVICIEANHIIQDWRPLLVDNSYEKVFFDGLNEYYVDTKTNRAKQFNYVDHVIMNLKGGVAADDYDRISAAENITAEQRREIVMLEQSLKSAKGLLKRLIVLLPAKTSQKLGLKKVK